MSIRAIWYCECLTVPFLCILSAETDFDWKAACIKREEEYRKWKAPHHTLHRANIRFTAGVDAVHITEVGESSSIQFLILRSGNGMSYLLSISVLYNTWKIGNT